jgi:hypothetical protein
MLLNLKFLLVVHASFEIFPYHLLHSYIDQEQEEAAIKVFWVTDGIDRCLVGFLPRHCIPHRRDFDGKLAQIIEFLEASTNPAERARSQRMRGSCMAALIDAQHS